MRILVTRSPEDAERTAVRLAALGHEALIAPVTRIVPTGDPAPSDTHDALIVTSGHSVDALASMDKSRLVFVVGERTAEVVRGAGFTSIVVGEGDAVSLSRLIRERLEPKQTLLHVTGRHHKEEPATSLTAAGYRVLSWEVYEARVVDRLPDEAVEALRSGNIGAALHYSRRSADLLIRLAEEAGLASALTACTHLCLSADVAAAFDGVRAPLLVAREPSEDALLGLLQGLP
ncbi:uroporphyrinogen-III synthase [Microvirga sp. 2YAF29]|uniref:uroporphyrinogen-III synthase n=1 Tax=Microvirga sp. 2YAF29 TaxID=3233031 RepID=UPI003F959FE3